MINLRKFNFLFYSRNSFHLHSLHFYRYFFYRFVSLFIYIPFHYTTNRIVLFCKYIIPLHYRQDLSYCLVQFPYAITFFLSIFLNLSLMSLFYYFSTKKLLSFFFTTLLQYRTYELSFCGTFHCQFSTLEFSFTSIKKVKKIFYIFSKKKTHSSSRASYVGCDRILMWVIFLLILTGNLPPCVVSFFLLIL